MHRVMDINAVPSDIEIAALLRHQLAVDVRIVVLAHAVVLECDSQRWEEGVEEVDGFLVERDLVLGHRAWKPVGEQAPSHDGLASGLREALREPDHLHRSVYTPGGAEGRQSIQNRVSNRLALGLVHLWTPLVRLRELRQCPIDCW